MKTIIRSLLLAVLTGSATLLGAQVVVDGVNINNLEQVSMVRMIVQNRFLSNSVVVFIDYGQSIGGAPRQRMEVVDPRSDKRIKFNSVMHAVNYMLDNNWIFEESMVLPNDGSANSSSSVQYLFTRGN